MCRDARLVRGPDARSPRRNLAREPRSLSPRRPADDNGVCSDSRRSSTRSLRRNPLQSLPCCVHLRSRTRKDRSGNVRAPPSNTTGMRTCPVDRKCRPLRRRDNHGDWTSKEWTPTRRLPVSPTRQALISDARPMPSACRTNRRSAPRDVTIDGRPLVEVPRIYIARGASDDVRQPDPARHLDLAHPLGAGQMPGVPGG